MHARVSRKRVLVSALALTGLLAFAAAPGQAASSLRGVKRSSSIQRSAQRELAFSSYAKSHNLREGDGEPRSQILDAQMQWQLPRSLPASTVRPAALLSAQAHAASMSTVGGSWREVTTKPYNSDDPNYRDPNISNSGGGAGDVTGRVSALAFDGSDLYVGGADGGVWKSSDGGTTWTPLFDQMPTTSIGAIAVNPGNSSVWVGTGEANTAFENYNGLGVYRSRDGGNTWDKIGGSQLNGTAISRLSFDGAGGLYAATSKGLYKRAISSDPTSPWTLVLRPGTPGPYGFTFTNDVQVQPGTDGKTVIASVAWRGGHTDYNGFYESTHSGDAGTWHRVIPNGIDRRDIGRAAFAYSSDGSVLYSVVESIQNYNYNPDTALMGVYKSASGDVSGPWTLLADDVTLANSPGTALSLGVGYGPGIQAWYNMVIGVDPSDSGHVYVGLEEVYETTDGGSNWTTVGPYWNFGLPCASGGLDNCPPTTHSDQHAMAFGNGDVWMGNDGGVYSKPLDDSADWSNHNADLRMLQYYYAGTGMYGDKYAYWGGLQDNGGSYLVQGAPTMVPPFGGDGGDVIVSPGDALKNVSEYVYMDMWSTTNAGQTDGSTNAWQEITPSCYGFLSTPDPCDPDPRFIAPFTADPKAPNSHWVAGGEFVWETHQGWNTSCDGSSCDWTPVYDTGGAATTTALAVNGNTIYAGFCGYGCNPSAYFYSGIATNYGGTWHKIAGPNKDNGLPQRYVFGLTVDPKDPAHIYAMYSAYSRRWIHGGGVGHVFESTNGGHTWTDISGNLPDAPADDMVISHGKLVLSTDVGVFITSEKNPGPWSRFGSWLPGAVPEDLTTTPDGKYIVVATHGRGIWRIPAP